jgi:phenylalanyl-tRNA synthetase beta chain
LDERVSGFYLTKGSLEGLLGELQVSRYEFIPSAEIFLHDGQSADLVVSGSRIGYLGALGPQILSELDLKKQRPEIYLFELNLDLLLSCVPDSIVFSPLAKYPPVERDIAIVIDEEIPSSRIIGIVRSYPSKLIEEISVFDHFTGGTIPRGKKSLAFNIVYRAQDRTLTDEEVESLHAELVKDIFTQTGGQLRK